MHKLPNSYNGKQMIVTRPMIIPKAISSTLARDAYLAVFYVPRSQRSAVAVVHVRGVGVLVRVRSVSAVVGCLV